MRPTPFIFLLVAALASADGARAQERPPGGREPERARQDTARQRPPQDTAAPEPAYHYVPPLISFELTIGTSGAGDAQTQPVRVWRQDIYGTVLDSAALTRSLRIHGGAYASLSGAVSLGPAWAVRLGVGAATATLVADYAGDDELYVLSARAAARDPTALQVRSVESGLRYRIPSPRRLQPYVELGVAAARWTAEGPMAATTGLSDGLTRLEAVAAVGGAIPLTGPLTARLRVSTRVSRALPDPAVPGDTVAASSALLFTARPPEASTFADGSRELLGRMRFEVGLSYDVRPRPRPASEEPSEPTSPPGR